jgi:hypothetical protein
MPVSVELEPNDAVLVRYLLGSLPVDEAEPIEEASIVDDDLSARLNAIERDLVDSYVRGELEGPNLAKFQSWYLSSPLRVQKVEAAREILRIADAVANDVSTHDATTHAKAEEHAIPEAKAVTVAELNSAPVVKPAPAIAPTFSYGADSGARQSIAWRLGKFSAWATLGFAAAILVLIVAVGFLTNKNKQLRQEVAESKKQAELNDQTASAGKNAATGGLAHEVDNVATVTVFLPAPTRGASNIPKVDVPAGTGLVVLSLGLGSTDADNYRAQLMNPSTQRIIWKSGLLRPGSDGTYVSVAVPANVLRSQVYLVQLTHDAANGKPELLGTYPFRAEAK